MYADASMDDMILINKRISEIDLLLGELQGDLNRYDSLIEYSTVTLTIRASKKRATRPSGKDSPTLSGTVLRPLLYS